MWGAEAVPKDPIWDVQPPQYGRGQRMRQAGGAAMAGGGGAPPASARAPSPVLPRIGSAREANGRGGLYAGGGGGGMDAATAARLQLLEERMTNMDRENYSLRQQLERVQSDFQQRIVEEVQRRFKMESNQSALAKSMDFTAGDLAARLAKLERAQASDSRQVADLQDLVKVAVQGVSSDRSSGVGRAQYESLAASANAAVTAVEEAHRMLAELRAAMRAKDQEDVKNRSTMQQKLALLFAEVSRSSQSATPSAELTRTLATLQAQVAAQDKAAREAIAIVHSNLSDRLQAMERAQQRADADGSKLNSVAASQLSDMTMAMQRLQFELEKESMSRRQLEADNRTLAEQLRETAASLQRVIEERDSAAAEQLQRIVQMERQATEAAFEENRAAGRDRMTEEGAAFSTIATRFQQLEAALSGERQDREAQAAALVATIKQQSEALTQLGAWSQSESKSNAAAIQSVHAELAKFSASANDAVDSIIQSASRDRSVLTKIVRAEIESRVKRDEETMSSMTRYVHGLSEALTKVRDHCNRSVNTVQASVTALEETVMQRLSESARRVDEHVQQEMAKGTAEMETIQQSLLREQRDMQTRVQAEVQAFVAAQKSQFDSLSSSQSKTLTDRLSEFDQRLRGVEREVEETSGAATDAVTALQRVFSEYRLVTDTKLAQLDAQAAEAVADLKHFIELELNQLEQDQQTALNAAIAELRETNNFTADSVVKLETFTQANIAELRKFAEELQNASVARYNTSVKFTSDVQSQVRTDISQIISSIEELQVKKQLNGMVDEVAVRGEIDALNGRISTMTMELGSQLRELQSISDTRHRDTSTNVQNLSNELQTKFAELSYTSEERNQLQLQALETKVMTLFGDYETKLAEQGARLDAALAQFGASKHELNPAVEQQLQANRQDLSELRSRMEKLKVDFERMFAQLEKERRDHEDAWAQSLALAQAFESTLHQDVPA